MQPHLDAAAATGRPRVAAIGVAQALPQIRDARRTIERHIDQHPADVRRPDAA